MKKQKQKREICPKEKILAIIQKMNKKKVNDFECEMGIDEAGRGPVLGSLVYGCLYWPIFLKEDLAELGFNDSKQLNEHERESLYDGIEYLKNEGVLGFDTFITTAEEISNSMLAPVKINLNTLSFESAMQLVHRTLNKVIY